MVYLVYLVYSVYLVYPVSWVLHLSPLSWLSGGLKIPYMSTARELWGLGLQNKSSLKQWKRRLYLVEHLLFQQGYGL